MTKKSLNTVLILYDRCAKKTLYFYTMAILIPDHQVCFIHIPKNAGTSVNNFLKSNFDVVEVGKKHSNLSQIKKNIDLLHSFCIIRNPFARLVSHYNYYCRVFNDKIEYRKIHKKKFYEKNLKVYNFLKKGFKHFVLSQEFEEVFHPEQSKWYDSRFEPQSTWTQGCGIILRYENLNNEWIKIQNILKTTNKLGHINKSKLTDYRSYYDTTLLSFCRNKFQQDLDKWEYKF